jgi:hypothetical protein
MRTTLTIEDSILEKLKKEALDSGVPLKTIVNLTLEIGLRNLHARPQKKYKSKTYAMGYPGGINFDKALQIASALENDEILKKMNVGK